MYYMFHEEMLVLPYKFLINRIYVSIDYFNLYSLMY